MLALFERLSDKHVLTIRGNPETQDQLSQVWVHRVPGGPGDHQRAVGPLRNRAHDRRTEVRKCGRGVGLAVMMYTNHKKIWRLDMARRHDEAPSALTHDSGPNRTIQPSPAMYELGSR